MAREVGSKFCETRLSDDEAAMLSLMTPSLLKAISEAKTRNDMIAKASPGEKSPFGDGIPYQSFMDGAPACRAADGKEVPGRTEVELTYSFLDAPDGGWTDTLVLVAGSDGLLIDDIRFETAVNDTDPIGLRKVLFDAFDQ
ncbi:MAG: hypothetical protein H0T56_07160 [Pseudaminobacter sp.]|nr:hypothetical protein [Pseudaminobacter sp.]